MENQSLGSAIEKIKREEEAKEVKLKAKREEDAAKAATERSLRELNAQINKYEQEITELTKKTDQLRAQVTILNTRRDALSSQLVASNQELIVLLARAEQATSEIHELRSTYCKAVQDISDECDVWALLTKPRTEPLPRAMKKPLEENNEQALCGARLKTAVERREKAIAERERLKSEPDVGEEFVRIKNALRYSLEMLANLRK